MVPSNESRWFLWVAILIWFCHVRQSEPSSFLLIHDRSYHNKDFLRRCKIGDDLFCWSSRRLQQPVALPFPLLSSSQQHPWESPFPTDGDTEETLLRMHLSVRQQVDDVNQALEKVQRFTQSFPFAAVLPVQPLQYLPTHDGGVDVLFLRKKTEEKGSVDGGIRFFVRRDESDDRGIEVLAKRNSQGQTVAKIFSERLVVQAYVKGVSGEERNLYGVPPDDMVTVSSVFHKWM